MIRRSEERVPLWVLGGRGMLAGELFRLLELHPALRIAGAVSRTPSELEAAHPHLAIPPLEDGPEPMAAHACSAEQAEEALKRELDAGRRGALVLALPHGEASSSWKQLRQRLGARADALYVVDLAADYRLRDKDLYARTYGHEHTDLEGLATFAYGLPEHHRERIARSKRVASGGCFATALQIAAVPAARAGVLDASRPWFFSAVTGSSGSGAEPKPGTHHPWRHGNLWAYGLEGHRHEAELAQALSSVGVQAPLHFLPHSGPFARGIHLTACLPLARTLDSQAAHGIYAEAYAGEPFVQVLADGVPDLRRVAGSNSVAVRAFARGGALHVLCTLDNLVKGGAGQALQCLNLMLGFPETWGLPRSGLGVC
jgi:N-acetyl-gamma-glutamyl-phosphate reductase